MTKKDVECQIHTWMIKNEKKPWYIRGGKAEEKGTEEERERTREEKKRKITSLGHVRRDLLLGSMIVS